MTGILLGNSAHGKNDLWFNPLYLELGRTRASL